MSPLLPLLLFFLLSAVSGDQQTLYVDPTTPLEPQKRVQNSNKTLELSLHPIDAVLPPSNHSTFLLRLLSRDAARAALLSISSSSSLDTPIVSGLAHGSGEYFARLGVGTPPTPFFLVLDTGSDVVWLQCKPCRRCYTQSDPVFDPIKSKSFAAVPCGAGVCGKLDGSGCDRKKGRCMYEVAYGDGSVTTGEFSTETVTFAGGRRVGKVAFGCGHDNEGLFVGAAGLLGLGRGDLSFPSQAANRRFGRRFSYCLVDRTSTVTPSHRSSTIIFGNAAVPKSHTGATYTPLLTNPKLDTFYYVSLLGVSVGGAHVPSFRASDLRLNPATGRGGVILDSGTSVTRLARPAYLALRNAFRAGATGLRRAPGFSLFDTCFDLRGKTEVKVPTVVLHFQNANVSLPATNYLIPVDTDGMFCFAFAGTDGGISIIGNIQQQGVRVVFDMARSRIGFVPHSC